MGGNRSKNVVTCPDLPAVYGCFQENVAVGVAFSLDKDDNERVKSQSADLRQATR